MVLCQIWLGNFEFRIFKNPIFHRGKSDFFDGCFILSSLLDRELYIEGFFHGSWGYYSLEDGAIFKLHVGD